MMSSTEPVTETSPVGGSPRLAQSEVGYGETHDLAETRGDSSQFISFRIGAEEYAVDIMAVREIKGWTEVTILPNQPDFMRGVLNLRGIIVPIFDMRCRFGMDRTEATQLHVIIIVSIGDRVLGLLVDAVSDILTVANEDVRPVPQIDRIVDSRYLVGLVTAKEHMVALLSLELLFSADTLDASSVAASTANVGAETARQA